MPRLPRVLTFSLLLATCIFCRAEVPSITQKTAGMQKLSGFFPLAWDTKAGKLYLEIGNFGKDFLFLDSLPYGVGSNDLGLDRGQLGHGRVVHFYRSGPKILLIERNLRYRATSSQPEEQLGVAQSFAESALWGFKVEAEDGDKALVDATDFFLHDAHGVAERLQQAKQGSYKLDVGRSTIAAEDIKNFPLNTEVESVLTFTAEGPLNGKLVASVTPDAHAVTVHQHYSFIQLPDDGYKPRAFDPRAGYFETSYRDYSAPLGQPMDIHLIARHRLQKKDPNAALSAPVKPIIYYVDRAAPEPIRSALVEGASWWNQAFEAAGYKNAFIVKVLPEGADPMDVRYNTIQWVHRSTRGWSYGEAVTDPRTNEIIKGQVTLGSLRSRQDYLIAEALLSPYEQGKQVPDAMKEMVLARIRQLAAHEVGHTLGLAHNFAASSIAPGTSVMDYPHPWITLKPDGTPDLSHAYATGIGEWDKVAITYGYTDFPKGMDEYRALDNILRNATGKGLYFITDEDSRPFGSAHPHSHLWDNGLIPYDELNRILEIRAAALKRFGENAIQLGQPMAQLEDTLVPLYLLHRYQTEAASKEIGGLDYRYNLRDDGQQGTQIVPAEEQRKALAAVLRTLDPATLTLPESLLRILPPRPPGYPRTRESFPGRTGLTFDSQGAVESAASLTAGLLFEPARASRLVEYNLRDNSLPGLEDVIDETLKATWYAPRQAAMVLNTQLTVEDVVLKNLLALAAAQSASPEARAIANAEVDSLRNWLKGKTNDNAASPLLRAHWQSAEKEIEAFSKDPSKFAEPDSLETPPGQPIGDDEDF